MLENAKYANEFNKATSLNGNLYPQGKRRKRYELGHLLGFKKITFEEYTKRIKELENDS